MTSKLADHLRALPDDGLGAFLQLRPDLLVPVPADISALAARAQGRVSVARALDALDRFTLEILDGLRLVRGDDGVASLDSLLTLATEAGVEPARVRAAVDRLRARFLAYGSNGALHLVKAIEELTSPYPAGLGRPAAELDAGVAKLVADSAGLRRTLLSAPPEARAVLDRLAAGPPIGSVQPGALRTVEDGESPVRWLVDHRLLVPVGDDIVELPREVGQLLRRDTGPLGELHPDPPALDAPIRPGADSAGAGQALEAVRHFDALQHALAEAPAPVLRSFGFGVRDLRRLARATGTSEPVAALLLEIGYAAGLLTYTDLTRGDMQWLPAPAYDAWRTAGLADQWVVLARTWLSMTRAPSMIGQRDDRDKPISALSHEATRIIGPATRRAVLGVLAGLPEGAAPAAEDVIAGLEWRAPRRAGRGGAPGGAHSLARSALDEAAALGVTGLGALTGYGRILLGERDPARDGAERDPLGIRPKSGDPLAQAVARLLPVPVDHMLIQADLTVVVPGPPEPGLAGELALVADAESRGGATVYRVTPASIRRALDAGYAAAEIHSLFRRRSRTPLPQTLTYLVDDVSRRHGGLRVGTAGSYLRSEDDVLLNEVLADKRLGSLSLRRLAPNVLATPHATGRLLSMLREAGYAPVPEDATGETVLTRPMSPRGPARPAPHSPRTDDFDPPPVQGPRLAGLVEEIRRGDQLARAARRSPLQRGHVGDDGAPVTPTQAHALALAVLQQALRDRSRVWVGFVDAQGSIASRLVRPVSMGGGYLRAEDDRTETLHTFALHRITSAMPDDD